MKVLLSYCMTMAHIRSVAPLATLKEKGQITLPVGIRNAIQAHKGDIFNFEVQGDTIVMTRQRLIPAKSRQGHKSVKNRDISKYIGSMKGNF